MTEEECKRLLTDAKGEIDRALGVNAPREGKCGLPQPTILGRWRVAILGGSVVLAFQDTNLTCTMCPRGAQELIDVLTEAVQAAKGVDKFPVSQRWGIG